MSANDPSDPAGDPARAERPLPPELRLERCAHEWRPAEELGGAEFLVCVRCGADR